jgi:hypothetical protein
MKIGELLDMIDSDISEKVWICEDVKSEGFAVPVYKGDAILVPERFRELDVDHVEPSNFTLDIFYDADTFGKSATQRKDDGTFVIIHDDYGHIYGAKPVGAKYKSREDAAKAMRALVIADCKEYGVDADTYLYDIDEDDDYAFTPRGDDGAAYKIIEI